MGVNSQSARSRGQIERLLRYQVSGKRGRVDGSTIGSHVGCWTSEGQGRSKWSMGGQRDRSQGWKSMGIGVRSQGDRGRDARKTQIGLDDRGWGRQWVKSQRYDGSLGHSEDG